MDKKEYFSGQWLIYILISLLAACNVMDKKTTMEIKDPERHYYPILRGQELHIVYEITNTGNHPLFITDIHTSCGCVIVNESSFKMLPAGKKGFVRMKYDSNKNIGYVKHYVTIYANLENKEYEELTFDVNVVPNALYTEDYEELYNQNNSKRILDEKTLVDGRENEKGYYTDPRVYKK